MDVCLLCLELRKDLEDIIHVDSTQWQEEKIDNMIEKHFWSMKTITATAWLCATCWQVTSEFNKFYVRIENAHDQLTSMLTTEIQEFYEFVSDARQTPNEIKEILETKLTITATGNDTLNEQLFCSETPENSVTTKLLVPAIKNEYLCEEDKPLTIKNENTIKEPTEETKFTRTEEEITTRPRKSKRTQDPLKMSALRKEKIVKKRLNKKIAKSEILNKDDRDSLEEAVLNKKSKLSNKGEKGHNADVKLPKDTEDGSESDKDYPTEVCFYNEEETNPSTAYYKPSTKFRGLDEFVAKNFKINCGICQLPMKTFQEVNKHSAMDHKQCGFVTCCNKKFFRRSTLVEHIHWHLDPEYFKCPDCGKVMADRRTLNFHARVHEKLERSHICDECGKGFARALALQRHKLIHLPDEKKIYSCSDCGKNFADKNLLTTHVRSVHLNKYSIVCELCGRSIRSKEVFERHMLQHEGRPLPTVSCDVCGLKMTDPRGLKRHKEIQHPEGGRMEYKCDMCPKISPTLKAHKKHVQYKHEMGYDFKCTVCDKAFKRAISLTEHMATHTGTVLYTCPYCPKTFNSNANMHNHRKKSHPKEWEEACRARYSGNLPPSYKPPNVFNIQ